MSGSTISTWLKVNAKPVRSADPEEPSATDRQERVRGFDQTRFSSLCVLLVGAGGLNGELAEGLVRKGIGCLKIFDPDRVELSNLNRQRFFAKDLGENKAWALVRNLVPEAIAASYLKGCALDFQGAVSRDLDTACDVAVCGVDNNRTRVFASRYFAARRTPVLITGVSNEGDHGYVFVQIPDGPCFGCAFPGVVEDQREPCPNTPAIKDVLKMVASFTLYGIDSLFMTRPRRWNYRQVFLDGSQPDRCLTVERRADCALCGSRAH
jgi:molybdopterin/thiamine biosynthesis adenylyltransferase